MRCLGMSLIRVVPAPSQLCSGRTLCQFGLSRAGEVPVFAPSPAVESRLSDSGRETKTGSGTYAGAGADFQEEIAMAILWTYNLADCK